MKSYFGLTAVLVVSVFNLISIDESTALPMGNLHEKETSFVEIRVISRKRRSIDYKPHGFDVELNAFDKTHRLQLRSASQPLFTKSFDYHELSTGANGELINKQKQIHKRDLEEVEQNIYVDHMASAAVRVKEVDGQLHMDGLIGRMRIRRDAETGDHIGVRIRPHEDNGNSTEKDDYVDNKRPIATGRGLPSGSISAIVEVCIVLDYANAKLFNFDEKKILEYVTPFVNTANNNFQTMKDPQITVQLSGVYAFKDLKAQPSKFTEKGKDGKVSAWNAWYELETWAYENVNLPKHDVIVVLYSDDKAVGCWEMSNFKGACQVIPAQKKTKSVIFLRDSGGNYAGADQFVHQLGHALGADQDGSKSKQKLSTKCNENDGYAMAHSYKRNNMVNRLRFSDCSKTLIKEFIQSTGGHCLLQVGNPQPKVLAPLGPNPTKAQQCEYYLGKGAKLPAEARNEQEDQMMKKMMAELIAKIGEEAAKNVKFDMSSKGGGSEAEDEKNECKVLVCMRQLKMVMDGQEYTSSVEIPVRPADGTPCGKGGKCQNEECVTSG